MHSERCAGVQVQATAFTKASSRLEQNGGRRFIQREVWRLLRGVAGSHRKAIIAPANTTAAETHDPTLKPSMNAVSTAAFTAPPACGPATSPACRATSTPAPTESPAMR